MPRKKPNQFDAAVKNAGRFLGLGVGLLGLAIVGPSTFHTFLTLPRLPWETAPAKGPSLKSKPKIQKEEEGIIVPKPAQEPGNECQVIQGLANIGNSCYLDSVLIALFGIPDPVIDKIFLTKNLEGLKNPTKKLQKECKSGDRIADINARIELQKQLNETVAFIRGKSQGPRTCTNFRKYLSQCKLHAGASFGGHGMQDAGEFLIFLFQLFEATVATEVVKKFRANDPMNDNDPDWGWPPESQEEVKIPPIISITERNYTTPDLKTYVRTSEDSGVYTNRDKVITRLSTDTEIVNSPVLAFTVERISDGKFWTKPIVAPPQIDLSKGKPLFLKSIVIYNGRAHYICYFECRDTWYEYNDLGPRFTKIGTFEEMMKSHVPKPSTHGTIFIYSNRTQVPSL